MGTRIDDFRKAVAMQEVEQVPAIPKVSGWVARFSGIPVKQLIHDVDAMVKAHIDAQRLLGCDALFASINPLHIPEAFGCSITYLTSDGADAVPLDISTEEEVEALRIPDAQKDGRMPLMLKVAARLAGIPHRDVPVAQVVEGPFTTCARILGVERMMRAVMKKRPMIEKLQAKVRRFLAQYGDALAQCGADGLIIADPVGSSTMVSPPLYRTMVLPELQRLIRGLKIPTILHVCGDTEPILVMMAETGANVLSLDQCMDLGKAKQHLAGRCGIAGNVDPINTLLLGTPDDVKRETLKCLSQGGKKGYILMAGCGVAPHTPVENLRAMIETARLSSSSRS